MKTIVKIIVFLFIGIIVFSCAKELDPLDYVENGELRYPGKADSAVYIAGKDRLQVLFKLGTDPNITKAVVYWNLKQDSTEIPIDRAALTNNTVSKILDNLPENVYNFEIYTIDKFGNRSVPVYLVGKTYGDRFAMGVLNDRSVSRYEAANETGDVLVHWGDSVLSSAGVSVTYTDKENTLQRIFVSNKVNNTVLTNIQTAKPVSIQTLFKPEPVAIDTFLSISQLEINPAELLLEMAKPYASGFVTGFDKPNSGNWAVLWNGLWGRTFDQNFGGVPWADEAGWGSFSANNLSAGEPTWFTVDLGADVKVARYRTGFYWPYMSQCPKKTELWAYTGAGAPTAADGWNQWVKIGSADNSVLTTPADMAREYPLGDNMYTDYETVPSARYYRVRITQVWDAAQATATISEVTFWKYIN